MNRKFGLLLCFALAACGESKKTTDGGGTTVSGPSVRYVGRVDASNPNAVLMAWPGTAAVTRFEGSTITATVRAGGSFVTGKDASQTFADLYIDDQPPKTVLVGNADTPIVATAGSAGAHTARLVKRTEGSFGVMTFRGFSGASKWLALDATPTRMIEFIGDSVTAGSGMNGDPACTVTDPNTASAYDSFAAVTARRLQADYSLVACSGKGVYRNYTLADAVVMPEVYDLLDPSNPSSTYTYPSAGLPQVVIINLGTNDFSKDKTPILPPEAEYKAALKALVARVRTHYADAKIVLNVGPIVSDVAPVPGALTAWRNDVQAVLSELNATDANVSFLEFPPLTENQGCEAHPNPAAAANMADQLEAYLKTLMGW